MTATTYEVDQPDFRSEFPTLAVVRGERVWVRTCYELIAGRWEPFVSMSPAPVVIVEVAPRAIGGGQ